MLNHRSWCSRRALASAMVCFVATPVVAQSPAALPAYPDQASAYPMKVEKVEQPIEAVVPEAPPIAAPNAPKPVVQAGFQTPAYHSNVSATDDARRLAPPGQPRSMLPSRDRPRDAASVISGVHLPVDSIYTTLASLTVVVGLFLTCAWAVRRGQKKSNSVLPEGVVSVLGRVPLAARQFAQLVRVGNKLVLLSVTPHGCETLTEVTDPAEIDRLLGLCQQRNSNSTTAEFDQVFRQLAQEAAPAGFLGDESPRVGTLLADDPFAAYRGGFGRA